MVSPTVAKPALTPAKMILIGVLVVLLIAVLVAQFGFGKPAASVSEKPSSPRRRPRGAVAATAEPKGNAATPSRPAAKIRPWPRRTAAEVARHNPFTLPRAMLSQTQPPSRPSTPEQAAGDSTAVAIERQFHERRATVQQLGLKLIVTGGEPVAWIGDRRLRVGETIEGFRVAEIHPDGVVLEEANQQLPLSTDRP